MSDVSFVHRNQGLGSESLTSLHGRRMKLSVHLNELRGWVNPAEI